MKVRPIDQLVYEQMFPKPRPQDPQNFHALLQRHLILEVRQEVHSFYGHLDTPEAKYPGLDYNFPTHRIRLSRWQWHRRLFRAFDALRLTPNEISSLTKWEGTKWAKARYEREQNCVIRDTAMDGMPVWNSEHDSRRAIRATPVSQTTEDAEMAGVEDIDQQDDEDSEGELESVGIALNERLRERLAARNAGDSSLPLDDAWEQWFKYAVETGQISTVRERMFANARAGNWQEVPEDLQPVIRDALQAEQRGSRGRVNAPSTAPSSETHLAPTEIASTARGLSAPLSTVPEATRSSVSRGAYSGLRIPGAFLYETNDDGAVSHTQRTNA